MNDPEIVYQCDQFLALNKPPGLIINRAQSVIDHLNLMTLGFNTIAQGHGNCLLVVG